MVLSLHGRKSGAGSHRAVLGPLLFLIYINDLEEEGISKVFKFADDTKLFRQVSNMVDAVGMHEDLDRLVEWADKWQLQFNVSKCKVMHVWKKNPRHPYYIIIIIQIIQTFVTRTVSANILNLRRRQSLGEEDGGSEV